MRILLVVQAHLKSFLKTLNYIVSSRRRNKLQIRANFLTEFVLPTDGVHIHVYFVSNNKYGDVLTLLSHLIIPVLKVSICHLSIHIKH